jgi:hypothetical protein
VLDENDRLLRRWSACCCASTASSPMTARPAPPECAQAVLQAREESKESLPATPGAASVRPAVGVQMAAACGLQG